MFSLGSAWRGIKAIELPYAEPKPGWKIQFSRKHPWFWCDLWTPTWHRGRGPYLSMGLGFVAIYRGY